MTAKVEYELSSPPSDGITSVAFAQSFGSPLLLASSWDKSVYLYDVTKDTDSRRSTYSHGRAVLDCCFPELTRAFSGGLEGSLVTFDFHAQQSAILGELVYPVRHSHSENGVTTVTQECMMMLYGVWNSAQSWGLSSLEVGIVLLNCGILDSVIQLVHTISLVRLCWFRPH